MIDILTGVVTVWLIITTIWYLKIYKKTFILPKSNRLFHIIMFAFLLIFLVCKFIFKIIHLKVTFLLFLTIIAINQTWYIFQFKKLNK